MAMQVDEEDRKLFVGGLPQECTQEDLKEYFGQFGELERVQLKMDPTTGRSRGFAFVLYADTVGLEGAVAADHNIKGKKATVKKADVKPGKIYLGKLPDQGVSEDDIRTALGEWGVVTEVIRPIDKQKNNEPKNFCFVTFEKERISKKLIQQGNIHVNGHRLMVKEVTPNPRDPNQRGGMRGGARGGGYGGGWDQSGYGGGYGAGAWGDQSGGYGGGWDQSGGYGGYGAQGGYDQSGYGAAAGGYGGGYGGGQMGGGGKMRGGRGGGMGGGRGRGRGRGTPY